MRLEHSLGGGMSTEGERLSQPVLTVVLTDAARHPLKNGMEAGGIESTRKAALIRISHYNRPFFKR